MATASQIIKKAESYIGVKESPAGSNNVVFNTDYYGYPVSGPYYWCCTFVWDIFRMCGASNLFYDGQKTASCTAVLRWAQRNGLTVNNSSGKKGDIILFDWDCSGDADHIGLIKERNSDGSYTTIEGNTSTSNNSNGGEVMERRRNSFIRAIIRPKYEAEKNIVYQAHCQSYGWMPWVIDGETAGTTGKEKRLEAIKAKLEGIGGNVWITAHVQSYGWLDPVKNEEIAGTVGKQKSLQAVKIKITGNAGRRYDVYYRMHCQSYGWLDWAKNGEIAGTVGLGKRGEAIQIMLVKKGEEAPGKTDRPCVIKEKI